MPALRHLCLCLALLLPLAAEWPAHSETLPICYNYGCKQRGEAVLGPLDNDQLASLLDQPDAEGERAAVGQAIGLMNQDRRAYHADCRRPGRQCSGQRRRQPGIALTTAATPPPICTICWSTAGCAFIGAGACLAPPWLVDLITPP